jgi:hypothetical protein
MSVKTPTNELTERFINGLKDYNLSYEEIIKQNWKYCGGNYGSHFNYFKLFWGDDDLPRNEEFCVCGHAIKNNCYITNGEEILVLGNCCIKKFIPNSSRTCEICGEPHKNRVVNRCYTCRIGRCDNCGENCNTSYKKCYNCAFNKNYNEKGICEKCGKNCNTSYKKCYNCFLLDN